MVSSGDDLLRLSSFCFLALEIDKGPRRFSAEEEKGKGHVFCYRTFWYLHREFVHLHRLLSLLPSTSRH